MSQINSRRLCLCNLATDIPCATALQVKHCSATCSPHNKTNSNVSGSSRDLLRPSASRTTATQSLLTRSQQGKTLPYTLKHFKRGFPLKASTPVALPKHNYSHQLPKHEQACRTTEVPCLKHELSQTLPGLRDPGLCSLVLLLQLLRRFAAQMLSSSFGRATCLVRTRSLRFLRVGQQQVSLVCDPNQEIPCTHRLAVPLVHTVRKRKLIWKIVVVCFCGHVSIATLLLGHQLRLRPHLAIGAPADCCRSHCQM